ncbi:mitochondrial 54S ribosomal mL50 protein [Aspergillus clavatus NRRL 1]|uniref:Large ribosomal subunit protein mL50 n=1 Tax=Aspergillus clavatus (strain ATCC 1007 / CBS 513.65 / DSM 816 / NCTC 3887 / NRRL 1 / QM 1276 / 107) TaxID=344612 RepID=A1CD96_ASPCL|nr:uncharacterized protein ACLA_005790 [Aspergillus clavatus NRRL 1]EAW11823.1 conserved hypothetical protein [Aspergillus clavatus NRRL 1]
MRQSLRLLNLEVSSLQGPRSLYVCSTCRQEVRPRPILVRQFLRNASNATPLTERVRRKIWGTDSPPGLKDPYGGEGVLERRWKNQPGKEEEGLASEPAQALETETAATEEIVSEDNYVPASSWKGLPRVGHLGKWSDLPPSPADTFNPFMLKKKLTKKGHIYLAAHQAAVELCLMHALKKPLASICDVAAHEKPVFKLIWKCKIDPNAKTQWEESLVYPDNEAKDALVYIFEQIGGQAEAAVAPETSAEEVQEDAVDYEEGVEGVASNNTIPLFFGYRTVPDKGFLSLPLSDADVKFAFLKRFYQLSGHFFPDPVMHSISTVQQAVEYAQGVTQPKPTKLADHLANNAKLQHLRNVKLFTKRQTALHKDEELGRRKIIESELRARGLIE